MNVVKLEAWHVEKLKEKGAIGYLTEITPDRLKWLEEQPYAFTALDGEEVVACAGVLEWWPNRGEAWLFWDNAMPRRKFLQIHLAVKRFFEIQPFRRVEATVDLKFEAGHRWIKSLGFELEAECLKSYTIDGRDCALYSRIRGE